MIDIKHAILWDLDGTIVDTKECHFFTWQSVLHQHGYDLDYGVFEANFGRNNATIIPLLLGFQPDADLMADIIAEKETMFRRIAPERVALVPGVETWLSIAADLDYVQAIASSAPIDNITTILDHFQLEGYFSVIVSGTELPAKPEPDIFLEAARQLGCSLKDCLVIEDSLAGVHAAKKAGMKCVAVTTCHPKEDLSLADLVIDDFKGFFGDALRSLAWV